MLVVWIVHLSLNVSNCWFKGIMNVKMQKIVLSSMYTKCKCELGCRPTL